MYKRQASACSGVTVTAYRNSSVVRLPSSTTASVSYTHLGAVVGIGVDRVAIHACELPDRTGEIGAVHVEKVLIKCLQIGRAHV